MTKSPFDDEKVRADSQSEPLSSQTGDPAGFSGWTAQGGPPLHPLMQHPTASVAAAAAVGFGMASHFAGFLLGAMQGFMDAAQKSAAVAESERQAAETAAASGAQNAAGSGADAATSPAVDVAANMDMQSSVAAATVAARTADVKTGDRIPARSGAAAPVKTSKGRRAKGGDDLKRISGVGPKLEQVLINMGVTRFKDVAAWTAEDIEKFDAALGVSGRIVRDKWIEQAKKLAKG